METNQESDAIRNTDETKGDQAVLELLRHNPAVAHFVADLQTGVPLEQAVHDHFGHLRPADEAPATDATTVTATAAAGATQAQAAAADGAGDFYRPTFDMGRGDEADDVDEFFNFGGASVWD